MGHRGGPGKVAEGEMTSTIKKPPCRAVDPASPATLELRTVLLSSEKFINWKPEPKPEKPLDPSRLEQSAMEKHYTPQVLADIWGVSVQTIREELRRAKTAVAVSCPIPNDLAKEFHALDCETPFWSGKSD